MVSIDWDNHAGQLIFQNEGPAPLAPVPQAPTTTFAIPMGGRPQEAVAGASAP